MKDYTAFRRSSQGMKTGLQRKAVAVALHSREARQFLRMDYQGFVTMNVGMRHADGDGMARKASCTRLLT
ncbi:hypothetical protein [Nitratidesulfovibrio termitidis]|uniref:hypothetical protein n=1 Tax=Nitratidesulfovibrio termitidis TaxID=42252 RepID=UPI000552032C|nr:hypothetical protein [Nitratidesulfovibrio termitidis]